MTPADLALCVETYRQRHEDEYIERLSMAYYTAAWQRSKRMPSLKKIIDEMRGSQPVEQKRTQTPEEMLVVAMRLNAKNKGEVVTKGVNEHGRST